MRNRAKCKLCQSIIESHHSTDYVVCQCGEIALEGGSSMRCVAKDWANFIRIDEDGGEFIPKIIDKVEEAEKLPHSVPPDKKELLMMLDASIQSYENLPQHALNGPASNADLLSLMLLMQAILSSSSGPPRSS